eukprot:gene25063-biopygen10381
MGWGPSPQAISRALLPNPLQPIPSTPSKILFKPYAHRIARVKMSNFDKTSLLRCRRYLLADVEKPKQRDSDGASGEQDWSSSPHHHQIPTRPYLYMNVRDTLYS